MKAAIRHSYGDESVIQITELPIPEPNSEEIRVRVKNTTVNRTDCGVLTGLPRIFRLFIGIGKPKRKILGTDFAGTVDKLGTNVEEYKIGDRVWGFNDEGLESQAEYVVVKTSEALLKIPDLSSFEEAVASAEGAHYAINFINKLDLKPGNQVLVNGATGAIGSALVQMLNNMELHVTAVNHSIHSSTIKTLGAEKIIEYDKQALLDTDQKFHAILDTIGNYSFKQMKPLLLSGGRYLSSELGPNLENTYLSILHSLGANKRVVFPFPSNPKASLNKMNALLEKGKFKPLIDRTYTHEKIAEAYAYARTGMKIGNIIIEYQEDT